MRPRLDGSRGLDRDAKDADRDCGLVRAGTTKKAGGGPTAPAGASRPLSDKRKNRRHVEPPAGFHRMFRDETGT
jgi:hypothetical protein